MHLASLFSTSNRRRWLAAQADVRGWPRDYVPMLLMAGAGAGYWWSGANRAGLILVIACLALNWLGDSLDGTLARFRNCPRPRYGFMRTLGSDLHPVGPDSNRDSNLGGRHRTASDTLG